MHDRQLFSFIDFNGLPRVASDFWNLLACTAARMKGSRNIA
jgi:hypothetical protein